MTKLQVFMVISLIFGCYIASVKEENYSEGINWIAGATSAVALYFLMKGIFYLWTII